MREGVDLERLEYLRWSKQDEERLRELRPEVEAHGDALVEAFYEHLLAFDETRKLIQDSFVRERLKQSQHRYLLSLLPPTLDADYLEERSRIGKTHVRIGLGPRWYLGAYSLYYSLLAPHVQRATTGDPLRREQTFSALIKVLMLDAQIAMEAYIDLREQDLEKLNSELERMSRSLAHEYQEQTVELHATEERAKAAEHLASLSTLAAGLAHEVGTPMGVIRGHAEQLESAATDERNRWRARTIREQVDRVSNIIHTLLNIAKPRDAVRCVVDLAAVLEGTLQFTAENLHKAKIETEFSIHGDLQLVGDPDRLQQLFLNLVLNAVDAMPSGGDLLVSAERVGADRIVVVFADTGQGLPPKMLERIFDPFFTTKPAGQGNGLGLMVAKAIVADHGGQIEVESEPGRGAKFRIDLPVHAELDPGSSSL